MNILLASIQRSGSTYLFRKLAGLPIKSTTPKDHFIVKGETPIFYVKNGDYKIFKTHLPHEYWKDFDGLKIFLFGDIIQSIASTYHKRFEPNSFKQCGYFGEKKDIFTEDFLGFEHMFDSWIGNANVILRYENLKEDIKQLSSYGIEVDLSDFNLRLRNNEKNLSQSQYGNLLQTYYSLIHKTKLLF